jgi:hypothetical protein
MEGNLAGSGVGRDAPELQLGTPSLNSAKEGSALLLYLLRPNGDLKITVDLCNHTEYNRPDLAYRRSLEGWK